MRKFLEERKEAELDKAADPWMYRWYEHHGAYEDARTIQRRLLEICRTAGQRMNAAVLINNLAFEYQLEGEWRQAIPFFEEAANVFRELKSDFQFANSRANYWMCRFALDNVEGSDMDAASAEIKALAETIGQSGSWIERKPLILLAKIEEKRGNLSNAITLAKSAILSSRNSGTRYPAIDKEYLDSLRKKWRLKKQRLGRRNAGRSESK
jgi:tetratricopeptide (TPR) repeat protein